MSANRPDGGGIGRRGGGAGRPPQLVEQAEAILRQRRSRATSFPDTDGLFGDPAWDILLHLFVGHERGRADDVVSASRAIDRSPVLAERWVRALASAGLVRVARDGRTDQVEIAPAALTMMYRFLADADPARAGRRPAG